MCVLPSGMSSPVGLSSLNPGPTCTPRGTGLPLGLSSCCLHEDSTKPGGTGCRSGLSTVPSAATRQLQGAQGRGCGQRASVCGRQQQRSMQSATCHTCLTGSVLNLTCKDVFLATALTQLLVPGACADATSLCKTTHV